MIRERDAVADESDDQSMVIDGDSPPALPRVDGSQVFRQLTAGEPDDRMLDDRRERTSAIIIVNERRTDDQIGVVDIGGRSVRVVKGRQNLSRGAWR